VPDPSFSADAPVHAIARTSDRVYIGGEFTRLMFENGSFAALSRATGEPQTGLPKIVTGVASPFADFRASAVVPDGAGGWFVGGQFARAGDPDGLVTQRRVNLMHVLADGNVDPGFDVPVGDAGSADTVVALLVRGSTLFVGGSFASVGGAARANLAAVDVASGTVRDWNPGASGPVLSLAGSGSTLYAGGAFTSDGEVGPPPQPASAPTAIKDAAWQACAQNSRRVRRGVDLMVG